MTKRKQPYRRRPYKRQPYAYKMLLSYGDKTYTYIGYRTSKEAYPREMTHLEYVPRVKAVSDMLKQGAIIVSRTVIQRFEPGAPKADVVKYVRGLLKFMGADKDETYLNG